MARVYRCERIAGSTPARTHNGEAVYGTASPGESRVQRCEWLIQVRFLSAPVGTAVQVGACFGVSRLGFTRAKRFAGSIPERHLSCLGAFMLVLVTCVMARQGEYYELWIHNTNHESGSQCTRRIL